MINKLFDLLQLNGISSYEDDVIDYMFDKFKVYSDRVQVDKIGNVICKIKSGVNNAKKLVVFAHMDEIGFIIRKIEDNGFIRFERLGGVNTTIIQGSVVNIHGKNIVKGVIGAKSHHFMNTNEKFVIPQINHMYIDIGTKSKNEVNELGVNVGDFITFENNIIKLENNIIASKALDDRVGCAILLDLVEKLKNKTIEWDIYFVAAVMEEFNIRGILPAIRKIKPDVAIGIDITPACDTPDLDYNNITLGKGPALTFMNFHGRGTLAGVLPNKKLIDDLIKVCVKNNINYQREVAPGVITENAFIVFDNEGVTVANVSIPTRYTHTPIESVSLDDLRETSRLLVEFILSLNKETKYCKEKGG